MTDFEDLIEWLIQVAKDHDIRVVVENSWSSDWPPQSNADIKLVLYNPNWLPADERPISLAHEIGHVMAQASAFNPINANSVNEKEEDLANVIAIKLIFDYIDNNDFHFETEEQIINTFNIPCDMYRELNKLVAQRSHRNIYYSTSHLGMADFI